MSFRKFIVPELKLLTVIRQGVHEAGPVRFRDVCVCPKYKRGRLTRGIAFGVLGLCRSPSRLNRVALAVAGVSWFLIHGIPSLWWGSV